MSPNLQIVMPVYNDWESFTILVKRLDSILSGTPLSAEIIAVDDCSFTKLQPQYPRDFNLSAIRSIEILRLATNLGHQRAIAVGLVHAAKKSGGIPVVVMDSDGEDMPEDVVRLSKKAEEVRDEIVCAQRARRSEGIAFRVFYAFYRFSFLLMTGKTIDFGNFMIIKKDALMSLVSNPSLWNHLAATVVQSRIPIGRLETSRGIRIAGVSKMNFTSLFIHGLSAIAAFFDVFLVRLLFCIGAIMLLAVLSTIIVVLIRLFTDLAIPGWATTAIGFSLLTFLLASAIGSLTVLGLLSNRSVRQVIPIVDAGQFVAAISTLYPAENAR
ncbi:MAG: glycosyltransferase [Proteobacteria bacterium]|nr:glycosyltransferase [Pseudomonadota bacterium]